jgi:RNA ligase (TIGR02306 family)
MANFEVKIHKIDGIEPIANADAIEVANIMGYQCVVKKGEFKVGEPVVYIPEQAIVPAWLLRKMGLEGKLAGSNGDRVKAIKLRGVVSQGLVMPIIIDGNENDWTAGIWREDQNHIGGPEWIEFGGTDEVVGMDVAELLGIVKWEPEIPAGMAGEFFYVGVGRVCPKFDVENFKNFPDVLKDGEDVEFTEKIHGTATIYSFSTEEDNRTFNKHWFVTSKGQGVKGLALYDNEKNRTSNVYVRVAVENELFSKFEKAAKEMGISGRYTVFGESFGSGVQDLAYGLVNGKKAFRGFDVWVGDPSNGRYMDIDEKSVFFREAGVDMVPILYRGPYSKEVMMKFTDGMETVSGKNACIREGIVIRVAKERYEMNLGRVMLKSVSNNYLFRKNATEFN